MPVLKTQQSIRSSVLPKIKLVSNGYLLVLTPQVLTLAKLEDKDRLSVQFFPNKDGTVFVVLYEYDRQLAKTMLTAFKTNPSAKSMVVSFRSVLKALGRNGKDVIGEYKAEVNGTTMYFDLRKRT